MSIQSASQQAISDDQELAKVLAGINDEAGQDGQDNQNTGIPEPATPPTPMPTDLPDDAAHSESEDTGSTVPVKTASQPTADSPADDSQSPADAKPTATSATTEPLEDIKQEALDELRPLIDKLNVDPQEKFDICLLLIRSTDDKALIAPAHEAARDITDEAHRAQALLDIIKEIDFFTSKK
ncbi:hypothetical protein CR956_01830 [Candidatus Saccharibacteria bacterium]|nr:MAG: hypothetical protein CR956_01830 [Candidatus Saccharibacteria bacterium]